MVALLLLHLRYYGFFAACGMKGAGGVIAAFRARGQRGKESGCSSVGGVLVECLLSLYGKSVTVEVGCCCFCCFCCCCCRCYCFCCLRCKLPMTLRANEGKHAMIAGERGRSVPDSDDSFRQTSTKARTDENEKHAIAKTKRIAEGGGGQLTKT